MEDRDWLILKILQEEQSLTKVAERLFISQPALSYRLQNLEKQLNVKILRRYSNGVRFTVQGQYLAEYATEMLERFEELKIHLQSIETAVCGQIKIGFSSVVAKYKMAKLIKSYKQQYPEVEIKIETASSTLKLPELLQERIIDMAIIRGETNWNEGKLVIAEEAMCIVCARPIELETLAKETWIQYEAGRITKSQDMKNIWWQQKMNCHQPQIIIVDSIDACLQMVSCGLGWCIVPKIHLNQYRNLFVAPVVWPDGKVMNWSTTLIYRNEIIEHQVYKRFIEYIKTKYN